MDGYAWDDDEWMRRIEQAEDGDATASAVLALYDSLMSHDDAPSRGVGCLMGRQYRLARLASLPSAPARMLMDMAAVLVDGARAVKILTTWPSRLCTLWAITRLSRATLTMVLNAFMGVMVACVLSWGCVTPCTRTVWLSAQS